MEEASYTKEPKAPLNKEAENGANKKRKTCEVDDEDGPKIPSQNNQSLATPKYETISKRPKKGKPGFDGRMFEETSCVRKNGLRYVQPYFFTFTAHCKGRWMGDTLLDIFKREFRMKTVEYYEKAIKNGKITVNDKIVSPETIMTSNHIIKTQVHRHEPPVIDEPFEFVENSELMVVINKPSSIPVHPCGRYRHNTVVFILGADYGLTNLHTIHRIDRLTSGILMFAKTKQKAQEMEQYVKGRQVQKEYLCRVEGKFPEEPILCSQAMKVVSHKVGVCQVDKEGKEAETEFRLESFNGRSSVVRCIPSTGRMHQIRVHLQYIGFPIVNDPIYNHPTAWGEDKGKGGSDRNIDEVLAILAATRKDKIIQEAGKLDTEQNLSRNSKEFCDSSEKVEHGSESGKKSSLVGNDSELIGSITEPKSEEYAVDGDVRQKISSDNGEELSSNCTTKEFNLQTHSFDPDCSDCQHSFPEPTKDELVMYLHALTYKGPGWEYTTKVPDWAAENWHEDLK